MSYDIVLTNTGNATVDSLTMLEDFDTQFGGAFVAVVGTPTITAGTGAVAPTFNGSYDGGTVDAQLFNTTSGELEVGESITVAITVEVDPDAPTAVVNASGELENQATAGGDDPSGTPVNDTSDDPSDPTDNDPNSDNDPDDVTGLVIPNIAGSKEVTTVVANGDNYDVTYQIVIENTGTVRLDNITLEEDLGLHYAGALVGLVNAPAISASTATTDPTLTAGWDGDSVTAMFDGATGLLLPREAITVQFTVTIDPDADALPNP